MVLVNIILAVFLFLGIGYSLLKTDLFISGIIKVSKYNALLYSVLEKEAKSNGLAREYTGTHQDSINSSLSTEKIYHWYANNTTEGNTILNKNNVIFANQCWQILRTTDTGGVKLLYNGETINNQCLSTRGNHVGYNNTFSKEMTDDYWYGTDYTYDSTNNVFNISGSTEFSSWNSSTGPGLVGKYTCGDYYTTTCSHPSYIVNSNPETLEYVDAGIKFMIGRNKNGTTLTDTLLVRRDEWYDNYSSTYYIGNLESYKYTCNTENANCTDQNLRMIYYKTDEGYYYIYNHYWGSSVTWDGTKYTLVNPIGIENYDNFSELNIHHYTCVEWGAKSCTKVAYVYNYNLEINYDSYGEKYVYLENGVTDPTQVLSDMFDKNTTNSTLKNGIEAWYKRNLLSYDDYLEDTIFCNNREVDDLFGWNPNGGEMSKRLTYKDIEENTDLFCTKVTDRFSVSNPQAPLTYKIGLPTFAEVNLANSDSVRKSEQWYWLFSPNYMHWYTPFVLVVDSDGTVSYVPSFEPSAVRPVVSLKAGTRYLMGDGSTANPYIITTS